MANVYVIEGRLDTAFTNYTESLKIFEQINHPRYKASNMNGLAAIFLELNKIDKAKAYLNKALEISHNTQDQEVLFDTMILMTKTSLIEGNTAKGKSFAQKALEIGKRLGRKYKETMASLLLGIAEDNEDKIKKNIVTFKNLGLKYYLAEGYYFYSKLLLKHAKKKEARKYLKKSQNLFKDIGNEHYIRKLEAIFRELVN